MPGTVLTNQAESQHLITSSLMSSWLSQRYAYKTPLACGRNRRNRDPVEPQLSSSVHFDVKRFGPLLGRQRERLSTEANALMPSPTVVAAVGSSGGEVSGQCGCMRSTIIVISLGTVHHMTPQESLGRALLHGNCGHSG